VRRTAADTRGCASIDDDDFAYTSGAATGWLSEAGAEYYIQVVGDDRFSDGPFTLAVSSVDDITVGQDNNGAYPRVLKADRLLRG
jgi:hypothetical protein